MAIIIQRCNYYVMICNFLSCLQTLTHPKFICASYLLRCVIGEEVRHLQAIQTAGRHCLPGGQTKTKLSITSFK